MTFHRLFDGSNAQKLRKCPECGDKFIPLRKVQPSCGKEDCEADYALKLIAKAVRKREKVARLDDRKRIEELKPLQYWLKRAEKAANAFVRERDREQPCISCGTNDASEWHASHWKSVGANSALRFDPANIHKSCDQCNVYKGGNASEYEARLPARIGQSEFERLKYAPKVRKWTREEAKAIEAEFKLMLKGITHDR